LYFEVKFEEKKACANIEIAVRI